MFGCNAASTPEQAVDLLPEVVDGKQVNRTKSRAYKIAVMSGVTGIHYGFLGMSRKALAHGLFWTVAPVVSIFVFVFAGMLDNPHGWLMWLIVLWPLAGWLLEILLMARIPGNHPWFGGATLKAISRLTGGKPIDSGGSQRCSAENSTPTPVSTLSKR